MASTISTKGKAATRKAKSPSSSIVIAATKPRRAKPSAIEKLRRTNASHGKVVPIDAKLSKWLGGPPLAPIGGTMLIPKPLNVDAALRQIKLGRVLTTWQLRAQLAEAAGASAACPLCTGIFARLAAEAAEEERAAGKSRITPYWRLIADDGRLNAKFPGGEAAHAKALTAEGWTLVRKTAKGPLRVVQPPAR